MKYINGQLVLSTEDAIVDAHIADATLHRIINDSGTSVTELWSASKISSEIATVSAGIRIKNDVVTSTEGLGNITLSGEQVLNGVTTSTSRVLVTDQTNAAENGIYVTAAGAWARAADYDGSPDGEVGNGDTIHVNSTAPGAHTGTSTKEAYKYLLITQNPITVGTTALTYTEYTTGLSGLTENTLIRAAANDRAVDSGLSDDGTTITSVRRILAPIFTTDPTYSTDGLEPIGSMYWDENADVPSIRLSADVRGQLFEELYTPVQNDTGVTIPNGSVVTDAGTVGASGNIRGELTVAAAAEEPFLTIGLATSDIANGASGKVTIHGKVRGIQTDGLDVGEVWSVNDVLYKSPTNPGKMTNVAPQAPTPAIPVAIVLSVHATNGTVLVKPTTIHKLTTLSDVNGTVPTANGQILVWDNDNQVFDFTDNLNNYARAFDVNQATHGFAVGDTVYNNAGTWTKSKADAKDTLTQGLVSAVPDVNNFSVTFIGPVTVAGHGFAIGEYLFTSAATAGLLTSTEPTGMSEFSDPVAIVLDANTLFVLPYRPQHAVPRSNDVRIVPVEFADSPYTVTDTDEFLVVDASGGNVVINLPTPDAAYDGFTVKVKKTDASGNTVTLQSAGGNIDDVLGTTGQVISTQNETLEASCDATNYWLG